MKNRKRLTPIYVISIITAIFAVFLTAAGCASDKKTDAKGKVNPTPSSVESTAVKAEKTYDVLIVKSPSSINFFGWKGEQDLKGASDTLQHLGVEFAFIDESELAKVEIPCKVLILPNTRCMSADAVRGIRAFVKKGGKVFATYMSAYRNEKNHSFSGPNNFGLSDVYGVDFKSWVTGEPYCEYVKTTDKKVIRLGRNTAMLVTPHKDAKVLAAWLLSDKKPYVAGGKALAAIVMNESNKSIYCGEDLFAPENSSSAQVIALVGSLLEKMEPGIVKTPFTGKEGAIEPDLKIPEKIKKAVTPAGREIAVGFKTPIRETQVSSSEECTLKTAGDLYKVKRTSAGEAYDVKVNEMKMPADKIYKLDVVSVIGKKPYLAVYDEKKTLVARAYRSLKIKSVSGKSPLNLLKVNSNGTYSIECYRGELEIFPYPTGRALIYNRLSMEEYLAGVVPSEMPASFPKEALKAMAVTSRTFTASLLNSGKHKNDGYVVCNTIHCQVYKGLLKERLSSSKAVSDTAGLIATYKGKPADTPFHAISGGYTADSGSVWKFSKPYLAARFDGPGEYSADLSVEDNLKQFIDSPPECYANKAGRFRWKIEYKKPELAEHLEQSLKILKILGKNEELGKIVTVKINKRAKDGRAQNMEIVTTRGVFNVPKDSMRWITSSGKISTAGLPSTFFYITDSSEEQDTTSKLTGESTARVDKGIISFIGGGWGHGVGLSQESAKDMASRGIKFDEIVKFYYKGVKLEQMK